MKDAVSGPRVEKIRDRTFERPSLVISCAHRWEAQPFIDTHRLKSQELSAFPFPLFGNEDGLLVLLTGQGATRAAAAVSALLSQLPLSSGEPLVLANFGIAGACREHWELASWLVINKVNDQSTDLNYFPDRLTVSPVPETFCITVPKPATNQVPASRAVYEMEASGIAAAAELYLPSSQWLMGKFVSDYLETEAPRNWRELVSKLEQPYIQACGEFFRFVEAHRDALSSQPRRLEAQRAERWVAQALGVFSPIPFTVSQGRQLKARLKAYALGCQVEQERESKLAKLSQIANSTKGETKSDHNRLLERLLEELSSPPLFSSLR